MRISASHKLFATGLVGVLLAGCSAHRGDIASSGEGIIQIRSACPIVAVAGNTGDVTLFDPPQSRTAEAIDVSASISHLQSTCREDNGKLISNATFLVAAIRRDPGPARVVQLPYFSTVVRGATNVVAKRVGVVQLQFPEGGVRAEAYASAASAVDKSAATLPPEIEQLITRPRRAGSADAANDPLTQPKVKEAIQRTSFELLVGFNLTQDQLKYNITR